MSGIHPAHVFTTLEEFLKHCVGNKEDKHYKKYLRYWTIVWKKHIEKRGHVPYVEKCAVCSGAERKEDIKKGRWKVSKEKIDFDEGY